MLVSGRADSLLLETSNLAHHKRNTARKVPVTDRQRDQLSSQECRG